jgi:hypothetical protein
MSRAMRMEFLRSTRTILSNIWTTSTCYKPLEIERPSLELEIKVVKKIYYVWFAFLHDTDFVGEVRISIAESCETVLRR